MNWYTWPGNVDDVLILAMFSLVIFGILVNL